MLTVSRLYPQVVAVNHLDLVADAECAGQVEQRFRDCVEAVRRVLKRQVGVGDWGL